MMGARVTFCALAGLLAVSLAGCARLQRGDYLTSCDLVIPASSEQADRVWDAVRDTLRRHRFRLDRVDRRAGVITTMPEMSQHFFEFWRKDVATRHDFWEATLNPIRRWVEVRVTRGEDDQWDRLAVLVHKQRLSSPDRQFNSTGAAYQYFGDSLPSTTGLVQVTPEDDRWLTLDDDEAMADYLLGRFIDEAGLPRAAAGPSERVNEQTGDEGVG
ncbi:MAG: hypothetical protein JSU63_11150 [Phycisphaerales bacterium]|nr:MAG: hypothetical protein JSU63_11150 [Phycisphaerales bacterium]